MKKKHTSVPWSIRGNAKVGFRVGPVENEFFDTAHVTGADSAEEEANAHFIIDAANNYELLKQALTGVAFRRIDSKPCWCPPNYFERKQGKEHSIECSVAGAALMTQEELARAREGLQT